MIGRGRGAGRPGRLGRLLEGTTGRILLLGALVLAFWFASAVIASAVGAFPGLGEALWSGVQHLLDPGALGDDATTAQRLIGVAQVVLGIVLVVGLALALLSEMADRLLRRLGQSDPPVRVRDHLLVVGAGEALLPILTRLQEREPGAEAIVLVRPDLRRETQERLDASLPRLAVRAVGADPTTPAGLERGAAASARAIAVLTEPGGDDATADVRAIEIATALAATIPPQAPPQVGVETRVGRNVDAAWGRLPSYIDAVVHDRLLGAVLTIVIRNPAFAALLGAASASPREGGLFAVPAAAHAGRPFGELWRRFAAGVPVGLVPGGDGSRAAYAPPPETTVGADDAVIIAAPSKADAARLGPPERASAPSAVPPTEPMPPPRGLLLGWSEALASMLDALGRTPGPQPALTVLAPSDPRERASSAPLDWRRGDPDSPAELAAAVDALDPEVVFVASGSGGDVHARDASALLTALHACRALGERPVPVLVEQRLRASPLAAGDERIHVVSASELAGEALALAALDPLALAVQAALVAHPLERLRVVEDAGGATFGSVYAQLLETGAVPVALARNGGALEAGPASPLRQGDELLIARRRGP